jgi:hypothetical protein
MVEGYVSMVEETFLSRARRRYVDNVPLRVPLRVSLRVSQRCRAATYAAASRRQGAQYAAGAAARYRQYIYIYNICIPVEKAAARYSQPRDSDALRLQPPVCPPPPPPPIAHRLPTGSGAVCRGVCKGHSMSPGSLES